MECIRLDTFCKQIDIETVDIIWMDLQGAELMALQGLGDIINNVKVIETELEIKPIYTNQSLFEEVDIFLKNKNFNRVYNNLSVNQFGENFIYIK